MWGTDSDGMEGQAENCFSRILLYKKHGVGWPPKTMRNTSIDSSYPLFPVLPFITRFGIVKHGECGIHNKPPSQSVPDDYDTFPTSRKTSTRDKVGYKACDLQTEQM